MTMVEQQLGQSRPASTTAESLYSPGASEIAIIKTIYVCNTTTAAAAFRIFVDDNGTTYDETTALFFDSNVDANQTVELNTFISMNDSTGNLGIRTDTASALTFTAFGAVIT